MVTSSDGLTDQGQRITKARGVSEVWQYVRPDKGEMSVGGMRTKLQAVDFALSHGITTFIVDGRKAGQILAARNGEDVGTEFLPTSDAITSRCGPGL